MNQPSFVSHRIRSIILLLGSAFACASLLVASLIYHFGPSGRYVAGHTLLSPQVMEEINQRSQQEKSKRQQSFVFNHIEFSYFDTVQRTMRRQPVSEENYKKFYDMVAQEKSLDQTEQLALIFADVHPSILTVAMQAEGSSPTQASQTFQIVQFKEDYFRVQLHNEGAKGDWAYFQYSNLYPKIIQLFTVS